MSEIFVHILFGEVLIGGNVLFFRIKQGGGGHSDTESAEAFKKTCIKTCRFPKMIEFLSMWRSV
jgi:hypothetical protein